MIGITFGLAVGPFLSSFIFKAFGFKGPFIASALVSFPCLLFRGEIKNLRFENDEEQARSSTLKVLLKTKGALLCYICFTMLNAILSMLETCLSDRLVCGALSIHA